MACRYCDPSLAPDDPRRDGLFGIRFGIDDALLVVTKEGERIDDAYEVDVTAGRAWRIAHPLRFCDCGQEGFVAYIDTGSFAVHQTLPAPCT